jgi:Acetyl-CoA carboxylase, carboxyltransferase component (subunits alpha and beta)
MITEKKSKLEERIGQLREVKERARQGGGAEKWEKQKKIGKQLTARERVDRLLDKGSFKEFGLLFGHRDNIPAEGVIAGEGTVNGRPICIFSQDPTVKGGSIGTWHGFKQARTIERAIEMKVPLVTLNDSPGARVPKPEESRTAIGIEAPNCTGGTFGGFVQASGIIPQISVIMGTCAGMSVYNPALTDFIFMVDKTSHMFITGPAIVKVTLDEDVTAEDLGGARIHCQISGCAHGRWPTEAETLDKVKELLSLLPNNYKEKPPRVETGGDPDLYDDEIGGLVPESPFRAFDVRKVIRRLSDNGYFFEIQPEFAGEMVVGFGRMDGEVVGFVANNSMVRAGSLTVDSSDKQTRFMRFCDCFNIPMIVLVDTSAYMPGTHQEHAGIIRHGAKVLYALNECTVPRIAVIIRKAYGGGNLGMGTFLNFGTDWLYMWPMAELGVLGVEQSVKLFYGAEIKKSDDPKKMMAEKLKIYKEKYANPIYESSANWYLEDVIEPGETRRILIRDLRFLKTKDKERLPRKHGNVPL